MRKSTRKVMSDSGSVLVSALLPDFEMLEDTDVQSLAIFPFLHVLTPRLEWSVGAIIYFLPTCESHVSALLSPLTRRLRFSPAHVLYQVSAGNGNRCYTDSWLLFACASLSKLFLTLSSKFTPFTLLLRPNNLENTLELLTC